MNRKAFNFYRSYYDVLKHLNDNEKLEFLLALLDKQFENIDPTNLSGMAAFAYDSQKHSIIAQTIGFIAKVDSLSKGDGKGVTKGDGKGDANNIKDKSKDKRKSKDKNNEKENIKFDFFVSLLNYGFEEKLIKDWLVVRKTKKASNTETAFKNFITEIEKAGDDKNKILNFIVTKSWQGFRADWYVEEKKKSEQLQQTVTKIKERGLNDFWSKDDYLEYCKLHNIEPKL